MAFYDQAPGKKKKISYGELGSWDEEGTHYRGAKGGRPATGKRADGKPGRSFSTRGGKTGAGKGSEGKDFGRKETGRKKYEGTHSTGRKEYSKFETGRKDGANRGELRPEPEEMDFRDYEYRAKENGETENRNAEPENILCGRNPIREALKSDRDIEKLLVQKGELSGTAREIVAMARNKKIMVQEVDKSRLDEITHHHQGMIAFASAYAYAEVADILKRAEERQEPPFIILLDGVTDPHNLGAIIRTAECTGAHGVIVPLHRSVGLTPAAVKASAGAIEHVPVARVTNLNRAIEDLKKRGIWVYAVTMDGKDYEKIDFRDGTALVIGAEGEGISKLTRDKCDTAVSLPMRGELDSLNASVAAGVMMYRVLSSRRKG